MNPVANVLSRRAPYVHAVLDSKFSWLRLRMARAGVHYWFLRRTYNASPTNNPILYRKDGE